MIRILAGHGRQGPLRIVADGVVLNPGLPDEPLPATLLEFARAVASVTQGKGPQVVELRRSRLLLLIDAGAADAILRWVVRGQPRSSVVRRAKIDLHELGVAMALALEGLPRTAKLRRMLSAIPRPKLHDPVPGFSLSTSAGPLTLELSLDEIAVPTRVPWSSLLAAGTIEIREGEVVLARSEEPPFLVLEDLARWARHALKPGRHPPALPFPRGGELTLDGEVVRLGRRRWPALRDPFSSAIGELIARWSSEISERLPALARCAPFRELAAQAAPILARTRQKPLAASTDAPRPKAVRKARPARPVAPGSVRKLSFEPIFETRVPFAFPELRLLGDEILAFGSNETALLNSDGSVRWIRNFRSVESGGVILAVDRERLVRLDLATGEPRWFRDSEGIDPFRLATVAPGMLVLEEADALSGRLSDTGLAVWHFRPPMGERVFASYTPDCVFAASASGQLAALHPETGEPFFRAVAPRPFIQRPVPAGPWIYLVLRGESSDELLQADAATSAVRWGSELHVRDAELPVVWNGVVATIGRSGDGWAMVLVDPATGDGKVVDTGSTGRRPPALVATEAGLLLAHDDGRTLLFDASGSVRFSETEAVEPSFRMLAPILQRGLALVASERPALYDLAEGRRLARLPRLEGLSSMAVDASLRVFVADDVGRIRGHRLRGHLAVVPDPADSKSVSVPETRAPPTR